MVILISGRTARVTFRYDAKDEDELTLEVGDIIKNIADVETGWWEGEVNGKRGLFPNNFVGEKLSGLCMLACYAC